MLDRKGNRQTIYILLVALFNVDQMYTHICEVMKKHVHHKTKGMLTNDYFDNISNVYAHADLQQYTKAKEEIVFHP